jgi:hypothetical protein
VILETFEDAVAEEEHVELFFAASPELAGPMLTLCKVRRLLSCATERARDDAATRAHSKTSDGERDDAKWVRAAEGEEGCVRRLPRGASCGGARPPGSDARRSERGART